MNKIPEVLVLMPTYNGAEYLKLQIDSILSQVGVNVTIYVSDDCSTDNTIKLLRTYNPQKIRIISKDIKFGTASRNYFSLIKYPNYEYYDYIALSDQDDIWSTNKLINAIRKLKAIGADFYSSDLLQFNLEKRRLNIINKSGKQTDLDYMFQGASAGCTYVFTARAAEFLKYKLTSVGCGLYSMRRPSHDWLIYCILRSHHFRCIIDDDFTSILYRKHNRNFYAQESFFASVLSKFKIIRSKWYREQILFNIQFMKGSPDELSIMEAIKTGGAMSKFKLLMNISKFRRKIGDRFALAVFLLVGYI